MSDTNITETYEFNTDIITSYDGKEQRIKTRQYPRHMFSYDYDGMDIFQSQYIRAILRRKQTQTQYIPYWPNVTPIIEDIYGGKIIKIPKELLFNFYNCDYIEVFFQDDAQAKGYNLVFKVRKYRVDDELNCGIIELKDPIKTRIKKKSAYVYPLINTVTQPSSEIQYVFARGTHTTLNFECVDVTSKTTLPPNALEYDYTCKNAYFDMPITFNERQVFLFTPSWVEDESVQLHIDKNVNKLDNKTGLFQYDVKSNKYYDTNIWDINLMNKTMIYNMLKFFISVSGKYKSFYLPTWVNDIEPFEGLKAGNNYIYTEVTAMYDYYSPVTRNKYIMVFTHDFKTHIYKIMGYTKEKKDLGSSTSIKLAKILLSENIEEDIPLDSIVMISYFNLVRLDSDELKLDYESDCVATTTLSFKEVDV